MAKKKRDTTDSPSEETMIDDYDTPWKEAIENHLPEFMEFFFPEAYAAIDWSRGYRFLEQELHQVVRDAEVGRGHLDKLVEVWLREGGEGLAYIHVEVQAGRERLFDERVFIYHYRIFDRFRKPVATLVVLADNSPSWRPSNYGYETLGCRMRLDFPVAKILDWEKDLETLLTMENSFALVTAAHLFTRRTRRAPQERYEAKWRLMRILCERNWDRQRIMSLMAVIDWLMTLPPQLAERFRHDWKQYEEEKKMPYQISFLKAEREEGIQQGIQQGMQQGMQQAHAGILLRLMKNKYGPEAAESCRRRVEEADSETLLNWLDSILTAETIDKVFN